MKRYSESVSSITTYFKCPKKYDFKYIQKLPDPSGPAAELGTAFHKAAYMTWDRQAWDCGKVNGQYVEDMLRAMYMHPEVAALPHPKLVEGENCEFKLEADLGGENRMLGYVDVLLDEVEYAIDFKTSSRPWDEKKILENFQHLSYPLGLRLIGRSKVKKFLYIVVTTKGRPQCQVITLDVSDEVCEAYRRRHFDAVKRISLDLFMPTPTRQECGWCPYKKLCPAWQDGKSPF